MKSMHLSIVALLSLLVACSGPEPSNNGGSNNGGSNNGGSNNGGSNNGGSNNGGSNNGSNSGGSNNGTSNNGTSNNGTSNNGTSNNAQTVDWVRIDTNFALEYPYAAFRLAADEDYLYALVQVDDEDPRKSWYVLRSADEGDSWETVLATTAGLAVRASYFGVVADRLVVVVPALDKTAMFYSSDAGTTWTETAPIEATRARAVAFSDGAWTVTGFATLRSLDEGVTWQPVGGTPPEGIGTVASFEGSVWGLSQVGQRFRLEPGADAWELLDTEPTSGTDLWVDGELLWMKRTYDNLVTSGDGLLWANAPTAEPDQWGWVFRAQTADRLPWFLSDEVPDAVWVSRDRGVTAFDVTGNYPRDQNGRPCKSLHAATALHAFAATRGSAFDAPGCTPGSDPDAGVYRAAFADMP